MGQNQELAVAQMRESLQKLGYSTHKYGDPTLMRFLIARSFDKGKAANMFVQWLKWRASLVPLDHIPDSQVKDELSAEKVYLQGLSSQGNPVVVVKSQQAFPFKRSASVQNLGAVDVRKKNTSIDLVSDAKKLSHGAEFLVHLLDKVIASSFRGKEIGNEKLIAIIDLQQLSYKNVDTRGLITGFQFLQAYYPERLAKLYFLHMPEFLVRVWRFASHFLEKATQSKIAIVNNANERSEFIKSIGEEALPEEYGGQAKLVLLQDFQLQPLDH